MSEIERVYKFGGTSMANPEAVVNFLEHENIPSLIVVSAPGKRFAGDTKVTDLTTPLGQNGPDTFPGEQLAEETIERFEQAYRFMGSKEAAFAAKLTSKFVRIPDANPDYYAAIGEIVSAQLLARALGGTAIQPQIFFDKNGRLDRETTSQAIKHQFGNSNSPRLLVVGGYYGFNPKGSIKVLERGGSDRTGAIYAVNLDVQYDNCTDVAGVYNANPKLLPDATLIDHLTRAEVREGAHGGTEVLQGNTIIDLNGSNIDVVVRNTFDPSAPGTTISPTRELDPSQPVVAISSRQLYELVISDPGMATAEGYLAEIFGLAKKIGGLSIEHAPAAQDAITLTFGENTDTEKIAELAASLQPLSKNADIYVAEKGVVYVVGELLRQKKTAAYVRSEIDHLLAEADIPAETVVSHPSSPSLAFLVERDHITSTQRLIFDRFLSQKKAA